MVCVPFEATGMDLEGIMLSEISHTEKNKYHMIPLISGICKGKQNKNKLIDAREQIDDYRGEGWGGWRWVKWLKGVSYRVMHHN